MQRHKIRFLLNLVMALLVQQASSPVLDICRGAGALLAALAAEVAQPEQITSFVHAPLGLLRKNNQS